MLRSGRPDRQRLVALDRVRHSGDDLRTGRRHRPDASGLRQWGNDYGYVGYGGPCPPPGPAHRYVFTVHALDVDTLDVPDGATSAVCRFTLLAHSIDSASFTATFAVG
ncbi:MAG: hypothetical protein R2719_04530 [Micropruina sp.]